MSTALCGCWRPRLVVPCLSKHPQLRDANGNKGRRGERTGAERLGHQRTPLALHRPRRRRDDGNARPVQATEGHRSVPNMVMFAQARYSRTERTSPTSRHKREQGLSRRSASRRERSTPVNSAHYAKAAATSGRRRCSLDPGNQRSRERPEHGDVCSGFHEKAGPVKGRAAAFLRAEPRTQLVREVSAPVPRFHPHFRRTPEGVRCTLGSE